MIIMIRSRVEELKERSILLSNIYTVHVHVYREIQLGTFEPFVNIGREFRLENDICVMVNSDTT